MSLSFEALLHLHDDPVCAEFPLDFDRTSAQERFFGFHKALEEHFGEPFKIETGYSVQDASFHSLIEFTVLKDEFVSIRFSNFGNMVAMCEESNMPPDALAQVRELLEIHGYVFVPETALGLYKGNNPGVSGFRSWWERYFDYI